MFRALSWLLVLGASLSSAFAQPTVTGVPFFRGKTIKFTIPTGPGGAYGSYGLVFSQYFGRHIQGEPTIVPEYRPGAGGIAAANYLFTAAPRDGTVIGMPLAPIVLAQHTGTSVLFDASKFIWIGQMAGISRLLAVWDSSPLKSFADLSTLDSVAGTTGRGSETFMNPAIINHVFGTRIKIVSGYQSSNALMLALERGEVSVVSGTWANFAGNHPDWLREGKVRFLAQIGLRKVPQQDQVPLLIDLARNESDRHLIEYMSLVTQSVGYAVMTPPGVPADTIATLRHAFDATMKDPGFVEAARKCCVEVTPGNHTVVEDAVNKAIIAPKALLDRFIRATGS